MFYLLSVSRIYSLLSVSAFTTGKWGKVTPKQTLQSSVNIIISEPCTDFTLAPLIHRLGADHSKCVYAYPSDWKGHVAQHLNSSPVIPSRSLPEVKRSSFPQQPVFWLNLRQRQWSQLLPVCHFISDPFFFKELSGFSLKRSFAMWR